MSHFNDLDFPTTERFATGQLLFGRFRLDRVVGQAGTGKIYLAIDEQLRETVALKILPSAFRLNSVGMEELKRDMRRSRKLMHRNIIRVHDFFSDANSAAVSMEWIDGSPLSSLRLKRPRMVFEPDELGPLIRQVCDALEYAYASAQLAHGDLRPSNILVGPGGEVKVTDFGVCTRIGAEGGFSAVAYALASGATCCISPRQVRGGPALPEDDIYSLGATVYELLTGKPLFHQGDILAQVCGTVPPSIRARRAELGVRSPAVIPSDWESTVAACLEKDPAKRPRSAAEVAARMGLTQSAAVPVLRQTTLRSPRSVNPTTPVQDPTPAQSPSAVESERKEPVADGAPGGKKVGWAVTACLAVIATLGAAAWWFHGETPRPNLEPNRSGVTTSKGTDDSRIDKERKLAADEAARGGSKATKSAPWENSLGMKFVPVPGTTVLFSIWATRRRDFEPFSTEGGFGEPEGVVTSEYHPESNSWDRKDANGTWRNLGYAQEPDHPVAGVSWNDAKAFCRWLTERELKQGKIRADQEYRLPTDEEWTIACGDELYPWGNAWPPPANSGNFRGEETDLEPCIEGYRDRHPQTSPVGSYAANALGLFDMGGNVLQWCEDFYREEMNDRLTREKFPLYKDSSDKDSRVERGSSWLTLNQGCMRSAFRDRDLSNARYANVGFRCVLVPTEAVRKALEPDAARCHAALLEKEKQRREEDARPKTYTVPNDFKTVQEALNAARTGDTVALLSGTYYEALLFRSGVRLTGADMNTVKITSSVDHSTIVCIRCTSGTISGITFEQTGTSSEEQRNPVIEIEESAVEIANCRIQHGSGHGFRIHDASPRIAKCTIMGNGWSGIKVDGNRSKPEIQGNKILSNTNHGIFLQAGAGGALEENVVEANGWSGIAVETQPVTALRIARNQCQGNGDYGIHFLAGASGSACDNTCSRNTCGIAAIGKNTSPELRGNRLAENRQYGIIFDQGAKGASIGNDCSQSQSGIAVIGQGTSPELRNNKLRGNREFAIVIDLLSAPRAVEGNTFENTGKGEICRNADFRPSH